MAVSRVTVLFNHITFLEIELFIMEISLLKLKNIMIFVFKIL